jgi:MFS family permease
VISAIAGQAISLPFSLLVFDETKSALLSAIMFISSVLPNFILPLFIAPLIDRGNKKKIIVTLDYLTGVLYLLVAAVYYRTGFNYQLLIVFSFVAGVIGSIYQLAYSAWYPDLIPAGFEQQGFAVSSSIYPTVIMIVSPIAAWLYEIQLPVYYLLVAIALLTLTAATFELFIRNLGFKKAEKTTNLREYVADCKAGFVFLRQEKGLRNIYSYMAITGGVSMGVGLMVQAYFQTVSFLTVAMLGFLRSAETLGRMLGGLVQYKFNIKPEKRYGITKFVYFSYGILDIVLLYTPYPFMVVNRFLCGVLGMTSYTLREASVQSYLPRDMRARVNAIFSVITSLALVVFQLGTGYVGDMFGFRRTAVSFTFLSLAAAIVLIAIPSAVNRKVYEATRVGQGELP